MADKKRYCYLFVCFALLAAAGSNSQNDKETQALLEKKIKKLAEWTSKGSIIRLTGDRFRKYVKETPRNYSTIVMLTALKPERQCSICLQAKEEYEVVANSWRYSQPDSTDLFFAMLDFDDGPDVFQSMKINSVPVFLHFPAKGKRKKGDMMDRGQWTAETLASWVAERTDNKIKVYRPINYTLWATVAAVLVVMGGVLYYLRSKLHFIFNHTTWAVLILALIFSQISGYMWNRIRNPPNMIRNQGGQTIYIHPNRGSQLVFETYIIMLLYGSMVVGFIMMNEIGSLKKRWGKSILALAGLACVLVFFFTLLNVFKTKSPYYPYGFFDLINDYVWKM